MRGIRLFAFFFCLAASVHGLRAQDQQEAEAPADKPAEPQRKGPVIERTSNGIVMIRGSRSTPAPAPAPAETPSDAESPAAPAQPAAPQQPSAEQSQRYVYDASGNRRPAVTSEQVTRSGNSESLAVKLKNINGREVPYLNDTTRVIKSTDKLKVSERVTQRFGPSGQPAGQEMQRIEERKLPDGTVETVVTSYEQDLNGRMQPSERKVTREKESNGVTRTVATTERPGMNGGFKPIIEEESVERKQGDDQSTIEKTIKKAAPGSPLEVAAREETTMRKQGDQLVTETTRFERGGATGELAPTSRTVGKLVERPDGTSSETVENYGYGAPGGAARDLNASSMVLQKVTETSTTVGGDGAVQERTTTRERSISNPSEFAPGVVTRKVSKPLPDGESVRTDVYEPGVNGRLHAVESVIEKVEK